jgi:hypothetical protein
MESACSEVTNMISRQLRNTVVPHCHTIEATQAQVVSAPENDGQVGSTIVRNKKNNP